MQGADSLIIASVGFLIFGSFVLQLYWRPDEPLANLCNAA